MYTHLAYHSILNLMTVSRANFEIKVISNTFAISFVANHRRWDRADKGILPGA